MQFLVDCNQLFTENKVPTLQQNHTLTIPTATVGDEYSLSIPSDLFNDKNNDSLSYNASYDGETIENRGQWIYIDSVKGLFRGTPTEDDIGNHNIVLFAIDPYGESAFYKFKIIIELSL